jgi:uncharacterized protein YyaL (SSP411 family)
MRSGTTPNRLIHEKSPYLLQHAYNPVDWYPWGEEAFAAALASDRPIFLSIGYSTCYWCHVMEREVFENPEIAAQMNASAINIKVDREERPDIDRIYMTAVQAITGSGGWPMSVFLTPDRRPFYGGTYIPPTTRYGRPGFPDLLAHITTLWKEDRAKILESGRQITEFLTANARPPRASEIHDGVARAAFERMRSSYDATHAGFGTGPKFPRPVAFTFLLRYHASTGEQAALGMTTQTLHAMARGGMADHLGGGFHRYSVDGEWRVPHFEKMLYDQAQLAAAYTEGYQVTPDPEFRRVVAGTLEYVRTSLAHPGGGFYSAEDAESAADHARPDEKEEGTFYLWSAAEIDAVVGPEAGALFRHAYGVEEAGNALHDPMGIFLGKNILYRARSDAETAAKFSVTEAEVSRVLTEARTLLLAARARRPRPHLDDKIITAWNGLMISAFAKAHATFGNPADRASAEAAATFVLEHLYDRSGKRLYRRYRDGDARFDAGLQDFAFLIAGLLDLYEATFETRWLATALELTELQTSAFTDPDGGFFDTPGTDPTLLARTKEDYDGAEPTGNAVSAHNYLRLGTMLDRDDLAAIGARTVRSFAARLNTMPEAAVLMAAALLRLESSPTEIILAGEPSSPATAAMRSVIRSFFLPHAAVLQVADGESRAFFAAHHPFLASLRGTEEGTTAYLCTHYACQSPTSDPLALRELLAQRLHHDNEQPQ